MASRYSRYDPDRRSRSPRDRSPDRFDNDRRRPSTDVRPNGPNFPPGRDVFGDGPRRDPPRGPRALIDNLGGPRGGGFDFRGGRGRGGRGRGGWSSRDESRDRGRDRDLDFRDRFRDERSREREREWERDRRDYRGRRSPIGRARSPQRDFRDREREGPPGPDVDRSRRNSRDGPLSIGSPSSEPPYGLPAPQRGGAFSRGRGRGGRGDWGSDRGRGRVPFEDRPDRYPRARSQEGRWGRERDERERDRGDRYVEGDMRRDPRDERDNRADLFRSKKEPRANSIQQEPQAQGKEISPPPVAPSAPAFGSVPNRNQGLGDTPSGPGGLAKPPPTAPRAFGERPPTGQEPPPAPTGPAKAMLHDAQSIPVGPRAQRPTSKQWISPHLKKTPDSPKMMRAQSFGQPRLGGGRYDGAPTDHTSEERRPRSSDSRGHSYPTGMDDRDRRELSAEPGEITANGEDEYDGPYNSGPSYHVPPKADDFSVRMPPREPDTEPDTMIKPTVELRNPPTRRTKLAVKSVRFVVPPKQQSAQGDASESDDDEDMADYFAMEIEKTEAELKKLHTPKVPLEVVNHYTVMSHAAMAKIVYGREGLKDALGDIPVDVASSTSKTTVLKASEEPVDNTMVSELLVTQKDHVPSSIDEEPTTKMDIDEPTEQEQMPKEVDSNSLTAPVPPVLTAVPPILASTSAEDAQAKPATTSIANEDPTVQEPSQMAVDNLAPTAAEDVPMETAEKESKPPSTPSHVEDEGDDDETESDEDIYATVDSVRQYMTTPPIESLPTFSVVPWDKDPEYLASLESLADNAALNDSILEDLKNTHLDKFTKASAERKIYSDSYNNYLNFTLSDDPVASRSRDKFSVAPPQVEPTGVVTPEPRPEGRGTGRRFASERDLERVLQASMREEDERRQRQERMQKEKYRSEKEATIPDMYWNADERMEEQFIDRTGYVPHDRLVAAWHVLPPINNFEEEEVEKFEKKYLELPKQWGKVAEGIEKRDFGTCIQYYYLMKKELNLKEKLRKQPKRRKKGGRGKQRSSALVSELGNGEPEGGEDNNENGENGERSRRPRRAAAPTWNFEQTPIAESENGTPASTPGRRGASAAGKGEQTEKVDGRKGRRKAGKDKEPKLPKPNQTLAAAPASGAGRSRSRTESKVQPTEISVPPDPQNPSTQFEQQTPGMQAPFQKTAQQPMHGLDRPPQSALASSLVDVMAAPPSLRPEPPPPPPSHAMTTFNLAQPQQDRKTPTQASSYWSVSEANDFPHLLKAFGSDWAGIAAHMGSKTPVMVKNYYIRQKDQGKPEWEVFVNEAEMKRTLGEKRPEPPRPSIGGRGRRYDTATTSLSRPLAAAPGAPEHAGETPLVKVEATAPQHRPQPLQGYGVPIAQAASQPQQQQQQQQQQHAPPPTSAQTTSQAMSQGMSQAMSPASRPMRAPLQTFGFPERERERERIPLPGSKGSLPPQHHGDLREQRQPLQAAQHQPDAMSERQKMEMQQREMDRERERERERERSALRAKTEAELPPQHPFGHRQPTHPPKPEPLSLTRHIQDPPRHSNASPYPSLQQTAPQPVRSLLSDSQPAQPPPMAHGAPRPMSALQQQQQPRHPPPHGQDMYSASPQSAAPTPTPSSAAVGAPPPRPPEPRKTSNIMSLLNDDPPPPPKRMSDMSSGPAHPSPTPPPPQAARPPSGPPQPSQLRREQESFPYSRAPAASAMPSLKPTYSGSPQQGPSRSFDPPPSEREYYRQHHFQSGPQSSGTNSPQNSSAHRYPPPGQPGSAYQPNSAYPTAYGSGSQPPPHASSPPPQYAMHGQPGRPRDVPQGSRDSWPPPSHSQPPSSGWPSQPPKTSQPPTPQQSWAGQHPSSKAGTPSGGWPTAPPPPTHHHHPSMREERGPPMYGSGGAPPPQQHQMQGRYPPPTSRAGEPVPPPSQAYPRYASTPGPGPGPGPPRDPRDVPGRSYTPAGYDTHPPRGPPPPPPGQGYPGTDPRDLQLRDSRDPRDVIARGLRPLEYERHPDPYGRG